MLSHELIISPPKNKSITIFESLVIDLEKDKEWTCVDEIGVGRGKFYLTITQCNIKEKPKPNLDQVTDNIQVELVVFTKFIKPIVAT